MAAAEQKLMDIIQQIKPIDDTWMEKAQNHTAQLVMPPRALGRLHDISERLCGIQNTLTPSAGQKAILIMAGDHGIAAEGVSAFPQEVTGQMVLTFLSGGAGINAISRHMGADVWVVDMGIIPDMQPADFENGDHLHVRKVAAGTANMLEGPAMTREQAVTAVLNGYEEAMALFENGVEILGTGDMGIGNTTPSAAIGAVFTGVGLDQMVGRGTGVDDDALAAKRDKVDRAIKHNQPDASDGLDVLAKVGGFEIGGIAGSLLAAASMGRPAVVDGFISTAGALVAHSLCPAVTQYLFSGHCSSESGHRFMLKYLELEPIVDLGMRLGEGTGAVLAMGVIESAAKMFTDMATFEQAGVSNKE
jgi:nicotinate-nucleotide--dimethylbenzimidazole phosphoribosyltransferase